MFLLALGCNDNNGNTNKDYGELTEPIVKAYFTNYHMKDCNQFYDCKVKFETPIEIDAPVRQNIYGALPPPDGGLPIVYPVKVDVSFYIDAGGIGIWSRYKSGIHYFYRDANSIGMMLPKVLI